jgi:hypothetical protein
VRIEDRGWRIAIRHNGHMYGGPSVAAIARSIYELHHL